MFGAMSHAWPFSRLDRRRGALVLVASYGTDADAVAALIVAATLHRRGAVRLKAAVATGGMRSAKMARRVLDLLGCDDVAAAVGTASAAPGAAAIDLAGVDAVDPARIVSAARLLDEALEHEAHGLSIVCGATTLADVTAAILRDPAVAARVLTDVCVHGGAVLNEASSIRGCAPP